MSQSKADYINVIGAGLAGSEAADCPTGNTGEAL